MLEYKKIKGIMNVSKKGQSFITDYSKEIEVVKGFIGDGGELYDTLEEAKEYSSNYKDHGFVSVSQKNGGVSKSNETILIYLGEEVEARVEFKMKELLNGVANQCHNNWQLAFEAGSQKHANYYEAFQEMQRMLIKEIEIPVPYNEMAEKNRASKLNQAIERAYNFGIIKRGERGYHYKERKMVSIIEEAQRW